LKVIVVIHDNHQVYNVFPLDAAYISAVLKIKNVDVDVEVLCMDVYHYDNNILIEKLHKNKYDIILMGFMAPRFRRTVRKLCHDIDNNRSDDSWFILGGYGPTAMPEYVINETGADIVCIDEAEETVSDLVDCIRSEKNIEGIYGIAYKNKLLNKIVVTKRRDKNQQLDSLPFPAWELFPMDIYTSNVKFAGMKPNEKSFPIISSRGCTDRCTFCFRLESGIRSRSTSSIINEMKVLYDQYGITYFYFLDELAIISKKQILNLTKAISDNFNGVHYRMDCRVTVFDDEIASALKNSGCVFLNIGFESSSQKVLDQMNKRATVEKNIEAAEIAIKHNIGIGINVIWGMPGDNEKTLRDNAGFIKKYNQYDQIRTIRPVTPYPGSPLFYQAIAEGKLKNEAEFFDRFRNSDRYMVNFMEMDEDKIYKLLLEVNTDLILDHFNNVGGDLSEAYDMISELKSVYENPNYIYTGVRQYEDNKLLKPKYGGM